VGDLVAARAVVLGGGMAGIFAARCLADVYAEVVVVDRDELTGVRDPRRGVPQGRHLHGLQARGQQAIEELFPGITAEMVDAGAAIGDVSDSIRIYLNGVQASRSPSGLIQLCVTRPFLERHVRTRLRALPNVTFLEGRDILGLEASADGRRVTGVRVQHRDQPGDGEVMVADLVVDASGRGSRTPVWLAGLGYPRVAEERIKIGLRYASRHYKILTSPFRDDEVEIAVLSSPATPRGAICMRTEDDRAVITAYGILDDQPPTDPAGFDDFLRSLQVPDIHESLQGLEPVDDPIPYHFPANLRRRYEHMPRLPEGLLVVGDAVSSFNPAYAQGMTVAALSALTLSRHLAANAVPEPLPFFRDLAESAVDGAWEMMTSADLSHPRVEGHRDLKMRIGHAYIGRVQTAATRDPVVAAAYLRVFALVASPEILTHPRMILRVLRNSRGSRKSTVA
jgi:2-polyprenyl-6-methoxyphenol hydroxylase-like FAD-dependent oxidoreductase